MRAAAWMAALVLMLMALSGCSGKGGGLTVTGALQGKPLGHGLEAPLLHVGDWWNFTTPGGSSTWVITGDTGEDYTMETDSPGLAYFNTQSDISTLGQIRKSDLAGSQGKDRVEYFQWPLVDGKNWSTTWDGAKILIKAKMETPERYSFEARHENGTLYATYTFDNRTHWFGQIDFKGPDGQSGFLQKLQASGSAYQGTLAHWELKKQFEVHSNLASVTSTSQTYDVPVTVTDVYVDVELHCTSGAAGAGTAPNPFLGSLAGTDPRGAGNPGAQCPIDDSFHGVAGTVKPGPNGGPETWGYDVLGGPATAGHVDFTITLRTLHRDAMK